MRVVELIPDHEEEYDRFVARTPTALLYHSLKFRDFLLGLLDCEPRYAVARRDGSGEIVGAMPVMATEGPYGTVLNSLPYFGSNGGFLTTDPDAAAALRRWYADQLAAPGVAAGTVIANPRDPDPEPPLDHDLEDQRVGHITRLDGPGQPGERLLSAIAASARRNVQKASRSGVVVDVGGDGMEVLERLHVGHMEGIGGRAKTHDFFKLVPDHFREGEDYNVYVASVDGQGIAALLVFYFQGTVEYYVPATSPEHRSLQPMAAILHRAMTDAATIGFRYWNWGGSWPGHDSLIRFKAKWGGQPRVYRYWTHVNNPDLLHASPDELLAGYPAFYVIPFSAIEAAPATR